MGGLMVVVVVVVVVVMVCVMGGASAGWDPAWSRTGLPLCQGGGSWLEGDGWCG